MAIYIFYLYVANENGFINHKYLWLGRNASNHKQLVAELLPTNSADIRIIYINISILHIWLVLAISSMYIYLY